MTIQLLNAVEEADLEPWGAKTWLSTSSPWRKKTRERLFEAIDRLIEFQEDVKAPNPQDPLVLSKLMAIVLRYDRGFIGQFSKRKPANPDWDRFCDLMAAALVQRWTGDRDLSAEDIEQTAAWDVDPDYLDSLGSLLQLAKEEGIRAGADLADEMPKGEWAEPLPDAPDLIAQTESALRSLLESHHDLAHPAAEGDIPLDAQSREIEKAALLDLRMEDLKAVAEERGIPLSKNKDRLVESIVDHGDLSREEIAKLVLEHYPDDAFERSMITHLVPLREYPDLSNAKERLDRLTGKYARIRVARWFVFQEAVTLTTQQLVVKGHLRGYRTKAVLDTDSYKVNATPQRTQVRVRLRSGSLWSEIDVRHVADVKDLRIVLSRGAEVVTAPGITPKLEPMQGHPAAWDAKSIWFLDFLSRALEDVTTEIFNFEMAHFERVDAAIEEAGKPQIDKVELRGQHIGAHRDSCSLITAGRRLLEIIIRVRFTPNANDDFFIPVQISLFADRATVATAPVRGVPSTVIGELHRSLVAKVRSALDHEVRYDDVSPIASKITERAGQASPAQEADLFAPHQDDAQKVAAGPATSS
jgi:hypothetical protein